MEPKTAAMLLGVYVKIAIAFVVISSVACVGAALLNPAQAILIAMPFFLAFLAASAYFLLRYVILGSMGRKESAAFLVYELESSRKPEKPSNRSRARKCFSLGRRAMSIWIRQDAGEAIRPRQSRSRISASSSGIRAPRHTPMAT